MTVEEFKAKYPEQAHLEGNDLWDAMTHSMIQSDGLTPKEDFEYYPTPDFNKFGLLIPSGKAKKWKGLPKEQVDAIIENIKNGTAGRFG